MFSLFPCLNPEVVSWIGDHRWIFMVVIPYLSPEVVSWFLEALCWSGSNRPILMVITFFAFGSAGFFSLGGMHDCRKALWDSRNVTDGGQLERMPRYKRIARWRACVVVSYGIATITFFLIAALSIER
jgi:hypothetical protein